MLAMAVAHSKWMLADPPSSRASLAPTGDWGQPAHPGTPSDLWEPSLLAMAVAHSKWMQADPPSSRASLAPTGDWGQPAHPGTPPDLWEPSLLAMAVAHSKWMQADPPSSRAGLAPTPLHLTPRAKCRVPFVGHSLYIPVYSEPDPTEPHPCLSPASRRCC